MSTKTVEELLAGPVPDELSAMVRVEPFRRPNGIVDTGWSCREHAVLVGALLRASGLPVEIIHGANMFVQGPTSDGQPPVGLGNDERYLDRGHTWAAIRGYGMLDVSPRLNMRYLIDPSWRPLPARFGVTGDSWDVNGTRGTVIVANSREQYMSSVALASHITDKATAIYWAQVSDSIDISMLEQTDYINSPLTGLVRGVAGHDAYLRLAAHLWGVMHGERQPLGSIASRRLNKAWAKLRLIPDAEIQAFRDILGERLESASPHLTGAAD